MTMCQRYVVVAASVLAATVGLTGQSQEPDEGVQTISGEVVEMMCYQRIGDDALGARHAECALKCATSGVDLAILSPEGLFIVTGVAAGTDELFAFISKTVHATGTVGDSNGGQTIDISFTGLDDDDGDDDEDQDPVMMVEEVGAS